MDEIKDNVPKQHRRMFYDSGKIALSGQGTRRRGSVSKESTTLLSKYVSPLTDEQKNELVKTLADLTTERNLKRSEEALSQRNQATEVIKNLAKENEAMKMENEELKSSSAHVSEREHDLRRLTKDNALLNELCEEEKLTYEAKLLTLEKLKQEMIEKEADFELHTHTHTHVNNRCLVELRKSPEEIVEMKRTTDMLEDYDDEEEEEEEKESSELLQ
ncbi:hypothetical protein RFI_36912 [Reticulomyxa filosa]|uniref:Uncharacterized protein n=1 Tax=Reticulomyxa filosa TaxID=46433 RepID=X6LEV7_RETFI|nr:hypothetical protein RFI_36912 [Reticulomyxa filosa]|eukprot:ETO00528.1 hypothetical protein RFI_36912 [Reticulomyxa filosa]